MVSATVVRLQSPLKIWLRTAGLLLAFVATFATASAHPEVTFNGAGSSSSVNLGAVSVGSTSTTVPLSFNVAAATTISKVAVLTLGAPGKEFIDAGSSTCTAMTYATATTCIVNVALTPVAAGLRSGAVVFSDASGNSIMSVPVYGIANGSQAVYGPGTQDAIPGSISSAGGLALDGAGNVYASDKTSGIIWKISPSGTATMLASGLTNPAGVAVDGAGNVYVASPGDGEVFRITPAGLRTAINRTRPPTQLNEPQGVAVDGAGNVYFTVTGSGGVFKVTPTSTQSAIGSGWVHPNSISVDGAGNVYVADSTFIAKVTPNGTQTVVGTGDTKPQKVVSDAAGDLYVAYGDSDHLVVIAPDAAQTAVGSGLLLPIDIAVDSNGKVYVIDSGNSRVVAIDRSSPGALSFATTAKGIVSSDSPKSLTVNNIGNEPLEFSSLSYPLDFPAGSADTGCYSSTVLASGATCELAIKFEPVTSVPAATSQLLREIVAFSTNSLNSSTPASIAVTGTESGPVVGPAVITSPTSGSQFPGSSVTFAWTAGGQVATYQLYLGTNGAGSNDLYNSGSITARSATVTGLPSQGVTVYARLFSKINGAWQSVDYTFTEFGTAVPAALTSPTAGSQFGGSSASFAWNSGIGVKAYQLWLGTTGVGSRDLYSSGVTTATSVTAAGLPLQGVNVNARLYSEINGAWQFVDYIFTELGTPVPAALTSPTAGSQFGGSSVSFAWNVGTGVKAYQLWLGTTGVGSRDLYSSGVTTATSVTAAGLPVQGVNVNARLYSEINGVWQFADYVFTEFGTPVPAVLTSPTAGSPFGGASVSFAWNVGTGVKAYQLWLGTTGVGSRDLYSSGVTTATSATATGLPIQGLKVYARLYSEINGVWQSNDYIFTECGPSIVASLITPTPGSQLAGFSVSFAWTSGPGVSSYQLRLGTTGAGSYDLYYSGTTSATSVNVTGLPVQGMNVYARLSSLVNGTWQFVDYTFVEQLTPMLAALTSPTPGSQFRGSSATFAWTAGAGPTAFQLWVGTTGTGSHDLYNSGPTTVRSAIVTGLPGSGEDVYVRLFSRIGGVWQSTDYVYTGQGIPVASALSTPTVGSKLSGSTVTFNWTAGAGVKAYQFLLGTTGVGSYDLYNSGSTTATTATVTGLPVAGANVYARLSSQINGTWQFSDYVFTEFGNPVPASLTAPTAHSQFGGSSVSFAWNSGVGVKAYQLWLGTTGAGSRDLYSSGVTTATSVTATGLPVQGMNVNARLYSEINGAWQFADYVFTEFGTPVPASLITPTAHSQLGGSSVSFTWNSGVGVKAYQLWLGTTGVGARDLYSSGVTTATTVTATGLPVQGLNLYARLYSEINGVWQSVDYTFTEFGTPVPASLTTPTAHSQFGGSSVSFAWNSGIGVKAYQLWLGTTGVGSRDLYSSGVTAAKTVTVTGLPIQGVNVNARLYSEINGVWQFVDYTFIEFGTPVPASMITPTQGAQFGGSSISFAWSLGTGVKTYQLWLGTTGVGSRNLYSSGLTTATSATVTGLPTNKLVYARLYSLINGVWQFNDYTYNLGP